MFWKSNPCNYILSRFTCRCEKLNMSDYPWATWRSFPECIGNASAWSILICSSANSRHIVQKEASCLSTILDAVVRHCGSSSTVLTSADRCRRRRQCQLQKVPPERLPSYDLGGVEWNTRPIRLEWWGSILTERSWGGLLPRHFRDALLPFRVNTSWGVMHGPSFRLF